MFFTVTAFCQTLLGAIFSVPAKLAQGSVLI